MIDNIRPLLCALLMGNGVCYFDSFFFAIHLVAHIHVVNDRCLANTLVAT